MLRRKHCIIVCSIALISICCCRFVILNSNCEKIEKEIYESNVVVPIGNNFYANASEDRDGYEIMVNKATALTIDEYLEKYHIEKEGLQKHSIGNYLPQYVYDVEVTIRNSTNTNTDLNTAAIDLVTMVLKSANHQIQVNKELFSSLYPQLKGAYGFKLRTNSEMVFHLPYAAIQGYDKTCDKKYYDKEQFYLLISMYPVEKMIKVNTALD